MKIILQSLLILLFSSCIISCRNRNESKVTEIVNRSPLHNAVHKVVYENGPDSYRDKVSLYICPSSFQYCNSFSYNLVDTIYLYEHRNKMRWAVIDTYMGKSVKDVFEKLKYTQENTLNRMRQLPNESDKRKALIDEVSDLEKKINLLLVNVPSQVLNVLNDTEKQIKNEEVIFHNRSDFEYMLSLFPFGITELDRDVLNPENKLSPYTRLEKIALTANENLKNLKNIRIDHYCERLSSEGSAIVICGNKVVQFDASNLGSMRILTLTGDLPIGRTNNSVVIMQGALYFFGGSSNDDVLNYLYRCGDFQIGNDVLTCRRLNPKGLSQPPPRIGHTASVLENKMYIFGGKPLYGNFLNDLYRYTPGPKNEDGLWEKLSPTGQAPSGRDFHGSTTIDGKMVVFGGWNSRNLLNDVFEYTPNIQDGTWKKLLTSGNVPPGRHEHIFVSLLGNAVLFGGLVNTPIDPKATANRNEVNRSFENSYEMYILDLKTITIENFLRGLVAKDGEEHRGVWRKMKEVNTELNCVDTKPFVLSDFLVSVKQDSNSCTFSIYDFANSRWHFTFGKD